MRNWGGRDGAGGILRTVTTHLVTLRHYIYITLFYILHFTPAESSWAKLLITRAIRQRDFRIQRCMSPSSYLYPSVFGHFTQTLAQYYFLNIFLEKKEPHSVFRGSRPPIIGVFRPPNPGGHIILPQKRPCESYWRCC